MERPPPSIGIKTVDAGDWKTWRALRLQALREAPHAFSSTLGEWQGENDTETRWRTRLATVPFNAIAELGGVPAGMVSASEDEESGALELMSMWVAPFARGCGAGDALVDAVVAWAGEHGFTRVALDVIDGNAHAEALYVRHGFVDVGPSDCHAPDTGGAAARRMERPSRPSAT